MPGAWRGERYRYSDTRTKPSHHTQHDFAPPTTLPCPILQLHGFHHLTAITANAPANVAFYTQTLGLRLVKKTVNQDDTSAYHLFYADGLASPGTDITFFDWPADRERRGTHSIARTAFRLPSQNSLNFWTQRLRDLGASPSEPHTRTGRPTVDFEDPEGQRLSFTVDDRAAQPSNPWANSPVHPEHQILGLGPITLSVPTLGPTETVLTQLMNMRKSREYPATASDGSPTPTTIHVFEMHTGGPSAELHVAVEPSLPPARQGAGAVHHVAFRTPDVDQYTQWNDRLKSARVPSSGPVDRFYFKSLYFREPNGILFEIATDGPGFATDEPMEHLGERLSLPPFLEPRRPEIEAGLQPL